VNVTTPGGTGAFANEDNLPRLPLPTLEESCARFIEWCAPVLTAEELTATQTAVTSFKQADGPGRRLQAALEQYNASDGVHSWLDAFWRYRYLGRRDRIALNANFFVLFRHSGQEQVERAAGLLAAAVNYKLHLDTQRIPPAVQRGRSLSMEQHKFLFSATRIPGPAQDTVRAPYSQGWPGPSRERHIVIFFRGNIFRMAVIGPQGCPHSLDDLTAGLRAVMAAGATEAEPGAAVGHLTTKARADWAFSRRVLLDRHPGNAKMLDEIETALFCLCLEDSAPKSALEACERLLHGDSRNRWFDKAFSLVIFRDGTAGVNVEHSLLDGNTIVSFADALLGQSANEHSRQSGAISQGMPAIGRIVFMLDDGLRADVRAAGVSFADYAAETVASMLPVDDFGADRAKRLRVSPDAFVQLACQLAHKRARGVVGATYESVATPWYKHGRTEAMRVVTSEAARFVAAMDDSRAEAETRRTAFRAAAEKHVARVRQCQAGRAPEQHLWELQLIQRRRGAALGVFETPALYRCPGWLRMREDCLSTSSTMPSANIEYGGFGPTGSRCIGVAYMLLPDRLRFHLSARGRAAGDMVVFSGRLQQAIGELQALLSPEQRKA
jgi:carnitine O-acetyltransferase